MSEQLRQKHYQQKKDKVLRMKADEEARKQKQKLFESEEQRMLTEKMNKKNRLREIQAMDSQAKAEFQNRQKAREVSDFGEDNVFSYIYTTKQHKSHEYAKKKDHIIDLIKDQFLNARYDP
jgi:hypothetical protein